MTRRELAQAARVIVTTTTHLYPPDGFPCLLQPNEPENGAAMPTADKLPTIAALLECEVNDLYDDETLRAASEAARAAVAAKGAADARALAAGK